MRYTQDPTPDELASRQEKRNFVVYSTTITSGTCLDCGWKMQIIKEIYVDKVERVEKEYGPWRLCMCGGYAARDKSEWQKVQNDPLPEGIEDWPTWEVLNYKLGSLPRVKIQGRLTPPR